MGPHVGSNGRTTAVGFSQGTRKVCSTTDASPCTSDTRYSPTGRARGVMVTGDSWPSLPDLAREVLRWRHVRGRRTRVEHDIHGPRDERRRRRHRWRSAARHHPRGRACHSQDRGVMAGVAVGRQGTRKVARATRGGALAVAYGTQQRVVLARSRLERERLGDTDPDAAALGPLPGIDADAEHAVVTDLRDAELLVGATDIPGQHCRSVRPAGAGHGHVVAVLRRACGSAVRIERDAAGSGRAARWASGRPRPVRCCGRSSPDWSPPPRPPDRCPRAAARHP